MVRPALRYTNLSSAEETQESHPMVVTLIQNVVRLCAVFLYNICSFHDFIETSAPIERHWITFIYYKNDENRKLFSKWGPSAILNLGKFSFLVM